MGFIKSIKIRLENKKKAELEHQSSKKMGCQTCAYLRKVDQCFGYAQHECWLKDPNFVNDENHIYSYKCDNYKPCRRYKKYLKNKK